MADEIEQVAKDQGYYFEEVSNEVERGMKGENDWIPYPFHKMGDRMGIKQSLYHLIGGEPGSGKSAFVDLVYVLSAYSWWKRKGEKRGMDLDIYLLSMERSREYRIAKWVCWKLFIDDGILLSPKQILGWSPGGSIVGDDLYDKIQEKKDFFDKLQDECVTVIDASTNPTGIWEHMKRIAARNGTMDTSNKFNPQYIPDDKKKMVVYILDHIGAVRDEREYGPKQKLDKTSEYLQEARDRFNFMCVAINQFNRNLGDSLRRKGSLEPEKQDFKGSGNMYEDCDGAIALFNPHEYHMDENLGYQVRKMVTDEGFNRYRSAYILKNTYGADNIGFGLNFIGEVGHYRKMPPPSELSPKAYRHYRTLDNDISGEHERLVDESSGKSISLSSDGASISRE